MLKFIKMFRRFLFSIMSIFVCCSQLSAQNDIIITKTDTIRDVTVLESKKQTDVKKVIFLNSEGIEASLSADEVVRYYANNLLFTLVEVNYSDGTINKEFAQLIFNGEVDLYSQVLVEANGKKSNNYLISDEKGSQVASLLQYRNDLEKFISNHLPQYNKYKKTDLYRDRINYSVYSLSTFTSYYNQFLNPEKYKATKFKRKARSFYIGLAFVGAATIVAINIIAKAKDDNEPAIGI